MEYLYSDEGQIGWLTGYCHPMRYNELVAQKKVPQALLDKLPPPSSYKNVVFPTLSQQDAAKDTITKHWDEAVGANVK
jgi:putative spermidine/putrescine transport system substrate-binding protein